MVAMNTVHIDKAVVYQQGYEFGPGAEQWRVAGRPEQARMWTRVGAQTTHADADLSRN